MVEESENVINDSPIPRNVNQNIPDTRLEPRSDKESLGKGKIIEESRSTPSPTPIRSSRIHTDLGRYGYLFEHLRAKFLSIKSFDTLADHLQEVKVQVPVYVAKGLLLERQQNKEETDKMIAKAMLQEHGRLQTEISSHIQQAIDNKMPSLVDASVRNYMSRHIFHVHPTQPQTTSVLEQQYQLYISMKNNSQLQQQDIAIWLALQMKFETLQVPQTTCRTSAVRPRDHDDPHDDAPPEGENRNQKQVDDYDFWTESYASNDDEIPTKQVLQNIMEEVSLTINDAELKKIADEMLRQRCTLGDEHQYHIDQMKNFLKSNFVWESRKEILASPHPRKTTPLVQSCKKT
ncbi:hypothetical protein Tco_0726070 [Tanacetum coccineum]|uniref:Uncharacterized protein n=1 Tax=Tanacetum coccineum TaxID=301880 RepID=A0ABQ4YEN0_9ASTR